MQDERRDRNIGYGDVWKGCAKDHGLSQSLESMNRSSLGEARKLVSVNRLIASLPSTKPRSAAALKMPSVPVTNKFRRTASRRPVLSSISTRSALISSASRITSLSPPVSFKLGSFLLRAFNSNQSGGPEHHARTIAGAFVLFISSKTFPG